MTYWTYAKRVQSMPSSDSPPTGVTCKGSNVWRIGARGGGLKSRNKRYMPAANSIHCQSVLERSVLFNTLKLASKLITVSQLLDLRSDDSDDIRWESWGLAFLSLFSNLRDVRKRASGVPERVLADETGKDLPPFD